MLQIVTNIRNLIASDRNIHGAFVVPSSLILLSEVLNTIVYFKPFEHDLVKKALNKVYSLKEILDFVNDIGVLLIGTIAAILLIIFRVILNYIVKEHSKKIKEFIANLLKKLMWGTIIRLLLQGYFQIALSSVYLVSTNSALDSKSWLKLSGSYMMIGIAFSSPVLAWFFANIYMERFK